MKLTKLLLLGLALTTTGLMAETKCVSLNDGSYSMNSFKTEISVDLSKKANDGLAVQFAYKIPPSTSKHSNEFYCVDYDLMDSFSVVGFVKHEEVQTQHPDKSGIVNHINGSINNRSLLFQLMPDAKVGDTAEIHFCIRRTSSQQDEATPTSVVKVNVVE